MRGRVVAFCLVAAAGVLASAGCSLFLVDGLTSDETPGGVVPASTEAGVDAAAPPQGQDAAPAVDAGGPSTYAREVLADTPVAYYPLDEASGDKVLDASGKGNDGYLLDATTAVRGIPGAGPGTRTALVLTSDRPIELGNKFGFPGRGPCTVEAWVRASSGPARGYRHIFSKMQLGSAGPVSGTFFYYQDETAGTVKFERWAGPGDAPQVAAVDPRVLSTDRFTHVVAVVTDVSVTIYLDGQLANQSPVRGDSKDNAVPASFGINFFGALDELAIYDHALSTARVKAHHDAGRGTP